MSVTPNVASDNTISLKLQPRVTEFEGFVEYGGPSIALSGETTAIVPAGFISQFFQHVKFLLRSQFMMELLLLWEV